MRRRTAGRMRGLSRRASETVALDTPAACANIRIVGALSMPEVAGRAGGCQTEGLTVESCRLGHARESAYNSPMFTPPNINRRDRGFTLIELLVVITIIAVLVGLLFPVGNAVMNNSRKTQASADEVRIVNACMAYQTDYGKLPINSSQTNVAGNSSDTCYGDPGGQARYPGYELYDILRAVNNPNDPYNSEPISTPGRWSISRATIAKNPSNPRAGFLLKDYNDGTYTIKERRVRGPVGQRVRCLAGRKRRRRPHDGGQLVLQRLHWQTGWIRSAGFGGGGSSMGADNSWGTKGNQTLAGSDDVVTWNK